MREFIRKTLVDYYSNCSTDEFGQVRQIFPSVFGDERFEVEQYCKQNKGILLFGTYSGAFGVYTSFEIIDEEIKRECGQALNRNFNYLNNINKW